MQSRLVKQIGERVRQLRREKNWTQWDLASVCEFGQSYIGQIERGEKNITAETLERLMIALDVTPVEFFVNSIFEKFSPE